jgi:hypothetical protein
MANKAEMKGFDRGFFAAVRHLICMHGCGTEASELFKLGGDPSRADPEDQEVFIKHGLMQDPYADPR